MASIYNSIMPLIKPGRIAAAAATLGETEHKVSAASDIILPSLLACMLEKGDKPEIEEVLKEGEKLKVWEKYDNIWQGSGIIDHVNIGERMENRLLGTHDPKFNSMVDHKTGMKAGHADRLTNWVAGTIAAWFSEQVADGVSYKTLLSRLAGEKAELRKDIPADIQSELGLGLTLGAVSTRKPAPEPEPEKRSLAWLWWLLGILALLLIILFCVRSCCQKREKIAAPEEVVEVSGVVEAGEAVDMGEAHIDLEYEAVPMVIDGRNITMYTGNMEEAVKAFLDSDKFRNATAAELESVWFEFSDIDFEHNSATELQDTHSRDRLVGLVNVLKNYPKDKIRIGAFTDKTGTRAVNYAISKKRAETIMATLVAAGFPAANISVEGFGEQFAAIAEGATNIQRAPDRDIAMRFTK